EGEPGVQREGKAARRVGQAGAVMRNGWAGCRGGRGAEVVMAKSNGPRARKREPAVPALSRITVAGFKSIGPERSIDIRPLTLLAGANSSGKSSIMQPLLLLKQTLEAPYDPGALLLDGPTVSFTSAAQFLARSSPSPAFVAGFSAGHHAINSPYGASGRRK